MEHQDTTIFVPANTETQADTTSLLLNNDNAIEAEEADSSDTATVSESHETSYAESETTQLPTPDCMRPLPQGRYHSHEEIYDFVTRPYAVQEDVPPPPGDKSNCFLLVDNTRNISKVLPTKNKGDFYDDCGTWISEKGRSTKTVFIESNGMLHHTEKKGDNYCYKKEK